MPQEVLRRAIAAGPGRMDPAAPADLAAFAFRASNGITITAW